ncbi:MAG: 4-hydroxy-tetrahydrodipicolinate reductase [Haloferacaceae archaeon]
MTRLAVTGAAGRMGREVLSAAAEREDLTVVLAVNRSPVDGNVAGVPVESAADLRSSLAEREPEVLVDFTGPSSSVAYAEACADAGVAAVVGTTGFDDDQAAALRAAGESVPVLHAANFAPGVAALRSALREAVSALPGYDVELTETHHSGKRDAPSGTAATLLEDVDEARGEALERVHGREGDQPRTPGEVGVHARRAGDVAGEHEVLLAANHETLTLAHRAGERGVFAAGALDAAAWLAGRDPGWYDFTEVLA